jgi:hypothetical protein
MKLKQLLSAGLAGSLALSACKPTVTKTHNRVQNLITVVQPGDDNILAAREYYDAREDLKSITLEQRQSLVLGRAKLRRLEEGLKSGIISLEDFVTQVIGSQTPIITDENTKLKVSHTVGRPVENITFGEWEWEIWTDDQSPNRILKNPTISSVQLDGGSLTVKVEGDEFDLETPGGKWDVMARTEGREVSLWKRTYTFDIWLVLAPKSKNIADK